MSRRHHVTDDGRHFHEGGAVPTKRAAEWSRAMTNALGDERVYIRQKVGVGLKVALRCEVPRRPYAITSTPGADMLGVDLPDEEPTEETAAALAEELHRQGYPRP